MNSEDMQLLQKALIKISNLERAIYNEHVHGCRNELEQWERIRDRLIAANG